MNPCWPISSCWSSAGEPVSGFTDRLTYEPNQLLLHVPGAIGALTVNPAHQAAGVNNLLVEGKGQGSTSRSPRSAHPLSGPSAGQ